GFWSITKYDDIQSISKNPKAFSSDRLLGGITLESPEMRRRRKSLESASEDEVGGGGSILTSGSSMIMMDPPTHTQHRRMVAPGFAPGRLNALIPEIRTRCVEILESIAGRGECEFVSNVAAELPIQMLAELLGVEQEDRKKLFEWSNTMIGGDDPDMRIGRDDVMSVFGELFQYSVALRESRQENPGDDLISMLVNTRIDGKPMELGDYVSAFILLVVAGNETTRNSISGGVLALSQYPEERRKLIDDPSLIPDAIDEIIRWVAPVVYMRRTALEDTKVGEKIIKEGDCLALWYMSGNRDEEKWDDPFSFNVTRNGPRHLSFGYGQHLCIGWRLAEIQLTVCLEELLKRFPDITVHGDVDRMRSNFLNSIKRMHVRYSG
ncbi:MAG: cytochrome P450, partial [Pseudomonadales bacterium]|nr:cytochrome P450 [Pseudomonadales bacterium]